MKAIVIVSLVALAFTTGFTCSKQAPTEAPAEQTAPAQEQMTEQAPPEQTAPATPEAAPAEGQAPAATETK